MHCGLFGLLDVAIRPPYPLALSQTFKRILFDDTLHCSAINADVTALVMPPPITKNILLILKYSGMYHIFEYHKP